ncbi:exocyst complex component SEC5A-like isoform X2 [Phoenix dactylifera]|uniref:Exocyst complex component SEC5 n=1 Tax=Phoenix dactylifera TaxID=42345 RepID=A0A8B7BRZ0_PHODC|nr:exocyst complex component SEC5A-like isoform X2 [Phoenix dactylifera]
MPSDSDIDEDELLQMALKEQAERDLSYQKPSKASKPVVNLIRAPPPPPFMVKGQGNPNPNARGGAAMGKGQRRPGRGGADDDDDSEVELLSISSGDEDTSRDRGPPQRNRGRKASRDEGDGDGDEPRSWKKVDEAELARRVREMRETRAAPAQSLEQKGTALGRKALTNLQSLPRGVEVLDPLGLGVIDNKSLRLITAASVSSPVSRERSDPLDPSTREKVTYSSSNFDPKVFLSRVHQETSAADLESGALTLKTDLRGRTVQKKQLVKENFDCFVSCKTTIDDIESKLRQIEEDPEGAGTAHLHQTTQNISAVANRAFEPLFERQVQAEKIRSVQGMLQRFRTLFNLPSAIRGSISKGEYDLAVREYRKAKSIVLPSHVGILKRVLEEVEKVMQEFRGMLYKSMEDPKLDLADLENIARLLLELEPDSDPLWYYLNIQNRRIRGLLEKCTLDHEAWMEILHNEIREKVQSDARWRQLQQDSNKSLDVDSSIGDSLPVDSQLVNMMGEKVDALRGRYICRLAAVLIHHMPAFWRLALSVFSGKFAKVTAGNTVLDSETNAKPAANRSEDKVGEVKYSSHSLEEVAAMVHDTISAFELKVHNTFRDFEESNILRPFMADAIREIAKTCQAFEGKESAPPTAVKTLRTFHFEITKIYILRLCSWMRATTKEIVKDETWVPLSTLERNKSPYAISYLPLAFRAMTTSAMDQIDVMIQNLRSEATKSDDILEHVQEIQESVRLAFLNCFLDFAGYIERIGGEISQSKSNKESNHLQNGYVDGLDGESSSIRVGGDAAADSHRKLLIVLSNIGYCKDELSHSLYDKYKHIWLQYRDKDEQYADIRDLVTSFSALEEKILEQYTFAKSNLVRTAALNYLLDSGVQWGAAPNVKGIRDATIELLHILVSVHAEVFSGARPLLDKTLGILVEGLIDTYLSLFHENKTKDLKSLDTNGFCQLMLELDYFETVLHTYFSLDAHEALKSLQGLLLEKACESANESSENPGHHRRATRGSEDAMSDDRHQGPTVPPDDLIALAQQYSTELLEGELERTRLNIACFLESSLRPSSAPGSTKPTYPSFQGPAASPRYRRQQTVNSPAVSRRRR